MLRQLSRILPSAMRKKLYRVVANLVKQHELENAKKIEGSLPKLDLTMEHIKNLKIVTNKAALLDVLPKHAVVAEIGVSHGGYSEKILSVIQPRKLYLIDAWSEQRYRLFKEVIEDKYRKEIQSGQIVVCRGLSTVELEKLGDGMFDWVYIDTDHSYKTTARELEICRKKSKMAV